MFSGLRQHHIGCLVDSIEQFKSNNKEVWFDENYSQIYTVTSQDVRVCFLQLSPDTRLELVEPGEGNDPLSRLLAKGNTYYHVGFITDTYAESVKMLIDSNCRQLNEFHSEAFDGNRCSFFYHPYLRLIELIESNL